ncbi:MAG TPA: extracellular solute-binding protein [Clostridiaceae bacterium]|nr:extracellular solute-binding protein [Clostridiaceae bacterium]
MTSFKKVLTILLGVVYVLTMLSGCGSSGKKTPQTSTTSSSDTTSTEATTTEPAPTAGNPALPLTQEKVTLKVWRPIIPEAAKIIGSYENNEVQKELEKRTGIHIEWISPSTSNNQSFEAFNLMVSSNELPDLIYDNAPSMYPGGAGKAVKDGIYLDVSELTDQYVPNYKYLRETYETFRKDTITDDGIMPGFFQFYKVETEDATNPWGGFFVRQDWLDELGLKVPVTYDDWYATLKAFKEKKNAEAPLFMYHTAIYPSGELLSGYQVGPGFYQVDGKVKFGPLEEGYREYLEMLNKWINEGLISKDFMTNKAPFYNPDANYVATGKSGIFWAASALTGVYKHLSGNEKYALTAIPAPVKNPGDKLYIHGLKGRIGAGVGGMVAVTRACKNTELAAKWINYLYSPDGQLLTNYGIEGTTYIMVEGKPQLTDVILKSEEGNINDATYKWTDPWAMCPDRDLEMSFTEPVHLENYRIWGQNAGNDWVMPMMLSLTEDETGKFNSIMSEINTYVSEMTLQFIIGEKPLSDYDEFVAQLKDMKIDEAIAIQQAALERYNSRK